MYAMFNPSISATKAARLRFILSQRGPSLSRAQRLRLVRAIQLLERQAAAELALPNPNKKKKKKSKGDSDRKAKRRAKVKKYAKKHGMSFKEAAAEIRAKRGSGVARRKGSDPLEDELLLEEESFDAELEEFAEEGEEQKGGMGSTLAVAGLVAALAAGALFLVRRR